MNPPKCDELDYIHFIIAAKKVFTCTEAARRKPEGKAPFWQKEAKKRNFQPSFVLFDSWYASLGNLKRIRDYGWLWLTRLKSNRLVNPDGEGNIPISQAEIPPDGRVVHLRCIIGGSSSVAGLSGRRCGYCTKDRGSYVRSCDPPATYRRGGNFASKKQ